MYMDIPDLLNDRVVFSVRNGIFTRRFIVEHRNYPLYQILECTMSSCMLTLPLVMLARGRGGKGQRGCTHIYTLH